MKKIISTILLGLVATFSGCYLPTSIDSGEVGVVKNWGEVQPTVKEAGLAMSFVPGDDLFVMRTTNKQVVFTDRKLDESTMVKDTIYSSGISVMTEQQLMLPLDISCLYQLNPKLATNMIKEYGVDGVWDDKVVVRLVRSTVRDQIGQVSMGDLITNRATYEEKIRSALNLQLSKVGVQVTTVNIQNIGIPKAIQDAVLAKETARQNADKAKYQVAQAVAEAQVEVAKAEGVSKANNILAGSLTDRLVQYKQLEISKLNTERWDGKLPQTMAGSNNPLMIMSK